MITEVLPSDTYRIHSLKSRASTKGATTAHVSQLKIWRGLSEESESDGDYSVMAEDGCNETRDTPSSSSVERPFVQEDLSELAMEPEGVGGDLPATSQLLDERRSKRIKKRPSKLDDYVV